MLECDFDPDASGIAPITGITTKASEDSLGALHGIVAEYLKLKIASGKATAAELGAAIAFLKNNSITADPAINGKLADLSATLKARRDRKGSLTAAGMKEAEGHFADLTRHMTGFPQ